VNLGHVGCFEDVEIASGEDSLSPIDFQGGYPKAITFFSFA